MSSAQDPPVPMGATEAQSVADGEDQQMCRATMVADRYRDGYAAARLVSGLGALVAVLGWLFAAILVFSGLVNAVEDRGFTATLDTVMVFAGVIVGVGGQILGLLIRAKAQAMKAQLDCAVNSSPFLTDDQRAAVMSLD